MSEKKLPLPYSDLEKITETFPTPFHLYDEAAMSENARSFLDAFSWNQEFKQYFAVKATPSPFIIKLLSDIGFGADCSSLAELALSEKCGLAGDELMFSSNDTPAEEFAKARELGAIINLDDISHIDYLQECCGLPQLISFRYNPGNLREGNIIIGEPKEAKYGFTRPQIFDALKICMRRGVKRFGLHTMVASNELDADFFLETAKMMFELAVEVKKELDISVEFLNLGGGIGIPYQPEDKAVDLHDLGRRIKEMYDQFIVPAHLHPMKICMECGRVITGPYGYLVSRVLHKKETYKKYVGLDSSMADLMRPAIYEAYHHITVANKQHEESTETYDVTGSLCENNDKFAVNRKLPRIEVGDLLVIHDTGAHGHAMGFNYNGKLRSAELLLRPDGEVKQIRRAETLDDYFATLNFDDLAEFQTRTDAESAQKTQQV
ncbi:MAG: diaminopimelate decarboxylase [Chitinivibrionales bacterium]|nr:diaminopimelate decarboxylase [Chitinivibrionales bacterium]